MIWQIVHKKTNQICFVFLKMISESDLCCKGSKCGECAVEVQDKDGQK